MKRLGKYAETQDHFVVRGFKHDRKELLKEEKERNEEIQKICRDSNHTFLNSYQYQSLHYNCKILLYSPSYYKWVINLMDLKILKLSKTNTLNRIIVVHRIISILLLKF